MENTINLKTSMRKLKLQVQMRLDGFVAGPNGKLDRMWIGKRNEAILQRVIELADRCTDVRSQ